MITDILGGKAAATDAAATAKQTAAGRKGTDAQSGGFSDALSKHDRDMPPQQSDDVAGDEPKQPPVQDELAAEHKPSKNKPMIDIRPEFLRSRGKGENSVADVAADTQETAEIRRGRFISPSEKKLRDALMAAKAVTRKSDELQDKGTAESVKAAASHKEAEPDTSILAADDAKVADMLSLLTGGEVMPAEFNGAIPKNTTSAPSRKARDADDRSDNVASINVGDSRRFSLAGSVDAEQLEIPKSPDASVPGTGTFRFTNTRNEGRSLDMAVDGGRERMTVEFKSSSNGGAENVTVLDSRRFLGLAPNSNGANLAALISGDSEWSAAMQPSSALSNAATQSSTGNVVNMLKLQMNPHDLGSVTATLRLHGEQLNVHLTVETRAAYRQLSEDSGGIVDALRAQGFSVDQVTISIAPTADSDSASNQQSPSGQSGQQGAAEGGRQGFAAGRQQEQAENRQREEQGARTANDAVSENTQQSGSGSARPDQLYL